MSFSLNLKKHERRRKQMEQFDSIREIGKGIKKDTAELELEVLMDKCEFAFTKAKHKEGIDLILNDYTILAQKYLYVLDLPVDHLAQSFKSKINRFKSPLTNVGPLTQD